MATSRQDKASLELLRRLAWGSLFIFSKIVLNKNLMEEQPHLEFCEYLTYGIDESPQLLIDPLPMPTQQSVIDIGKSLKKLAMLPRNSFKSTIVTVCEVIWLLWHNQNLRIMIDSETLGNAKTYLFAIKDEIANNELLRAICVNEKGEYLLDGNMKIAGGWTDEQIILAHRTKLGMKEPSVFCSGVDNASTGKHPDVIIMDDLVSERNVTTDMQIEKVKEHYKLSLSLLEPGGLQILVGTRYHMADLYGELIESDTINKLVRPAINENGELYFPKRLTIDFLREMRKAQGSYIYSCQYQLNPINQDNAIFKADYIKYIEDLDTPPQITEYLITCDPAIGQKARADYTVIMAVGIDAEKRIYVMEYKREHYTPDQLVNAFMDMCKKYKSNESFNEYDFIKAGTQRVLTMGRLKTAGIETIAYQKMLLYHIKDEMRRKQEYYPVTDLKADKDKVRRAQALQRPFENGDVYISYKHKSLERELIEFPYSEHDDTVDALAYVMQLLKPGVKGKIKLPKKIYKPRCSTTGY